MSLLKHLILGNLVILLVIACWGGFVFSRLDTLQKKTTQTVAVNGGSVILCDKLVDSFGRLEKSMRKFYVSADPDYLARVDEHNRAIEIDLRHIRGLTRSLEQRQRLSKIETAYVSLRNCFSENQAKAEKKKTTSLTNHDLEFDTIRAHLNQIIRQNKEQINANTRFTQQLTRELSISTMAVTAIAVFLGGLMAIFNTRIISSAITRLKQKTAEIATGRFKQIATVKGPSEIRDLTRHFNAMVKKLEELDDLKADFISHVSHELKTPITSIKEASIMLSKGLYAHQPEKQAELYALVHDESDRMLHSVLRLLDFSRMEARAMEYRFESVDLAFAVQKSILKLAPLARTKAIDLEFLPPPELPELKADKDRIREVLDNLIGNAVKFTPEQGRITVKCEKETDRRQVRVTIEDNGCGIKPGDLDSIFEKFKQIDNGVGTRMGTGLGLCISKHIINAHGGQIWAESDYPDGTRFYFTLPFS